MNTQPLLFGIIGFLLGGLVVSFAATQLDDDNPATGTEMTMSQMSDDLAGKTGDDFDAAFIASMIEHHQGAIEMAELAESQAKHDEIKQLSQDIITAQEAEIEIMKQWQQDWGYEELTDERDEMDHSLQ